MSDNEKLSPVSNDNTRKEDVTEEELVTGVTNYPMYVDESTDARANVLPGNAVSVNTTTNQRSPITHLEQVFKTYGQQNSTVIPPLAYKDTRPGADVKERKMKRDVKFALRDAATALLAVQRRQERQQYSPVRRHTTPVGPDSRGTVIRPEPFVDKTPGAAVKARVKARAEKQAAQQALLAQQERRVRVRSTSPQMARRSGVRMHTEPFVDKTPGAAVKARVKARAEKQAAQQALLAQQERRVRVRSTSPEMARRSGTPIPRQSPTQSWKASPTRLPIVFHSPPRRLLPVRFKPGPSVNRPDHIVPDVRGNQGKVSRAKEEQASEIAPRVSRSRTSRPKVTQADKHGDSVKSEGSTSDESQAGLHRSISPATRRSRAVCKMRRHSGQSSDVSQKTSESSDVSEQASSSAQASSSSTSSGDKPRGRLPQSVSPCKRHHRGRSTQSMSPDSRQPRGPTHEGTSPGKRQYRDDPVRRTNVCAHRHHVQQAPRNVSQDPHRGKGAIPKRQTKPLKSSTRTERTVSCVARQQSASGDERSQRQQAKQPSRHVHLEPQQQTVEPSLPTEGQPDFIFTAYVMNEQRDHVLFLNVEMKEPKEDEIETAQESPATSGAKPEPKPRDEDSNPVDCSGLQATSGPVYVGLPRPPSGHVDDAVRVCSSEGLLSTSYDLVRVSVEVNPILAALPTRKMIELWKPEHYDPVASECDLSEELQLASDLIKKMELRDGAEEKEKRRRKKREERLRFSDDPRRSFDYRRRSSDDSEQD